MKVTTEEYRKRCDMNLMPIAKLDINQRVQLIIDEVKQMLKQYEDEARAIYYPEKYNTEVTTK